MRKIARYFSGMWALMFLLLFVTVLTGSQTVQPIRLVIAFFVAIPVTLAAIVLGPNKHRLQRYALISNQILAVVSALALAWGNMTTQDNGAVGLGAAMLFAAVMNWVSMTENDRISGVFT